MVIKLGRKAVKRLVDKTGYKLVLKSDLKDRIIEKEFNHIYRKCAPFTMTSKESMFSLFKAVQYVVKNNIPGDFVECGVWKGGSSMVIARTLLELNETKRKIHLFDTFTGMSKPTDRDIEATSGKNALREWEEKNKDNHNDWCFSPIGEVKKNLISTGYPEKRISFVKGKVEDTISSSSRPGKIALLRLDTDFYESTKHELTHLFPVLSNRGVLIIDDYGFWAGAKKAADEYFEENNINILLSRIDNTVRIGIK